MRFLAPSRLALAAVIAVSVVAAKADAQVTVGSSRQTTLVDVGIYDFGPLAGAHQQSVGQIFRTPDNVSTSLSSWTLWASNFYSTFGSPYIGTQLQLQIIEWAGAALTGPALYTSGPIAPTSLGSATGDAFTFNVGQTLDPLKMYVALVSSAGPVVADHYAVSGLMSGCAVACGVSDLYTPGGLIVVTSPYTGSLQGSNAAYVSDYGTGYDLAFEATFNAPVTATPEPASMVLVGTGIAAMGGFTRRRRKKASQV